MIEFFMAPASKTHGLPAFSSVISYYAPSADAIKG